MNAPLIERIARRDRIIVAGALGALAAIAWAYTIRGSAGMDAMHAQYAFWMWAMMMIAMMTPTAAPMIFAYSRVSQSRDPAEKASGSAVVFLAGYLSLWTGFSVLAVVMQAILNRAMLLSPTGESTSRVFSASVLIAAGLYEFSPWKQTCLSKCRTPLGFLLTEWRNGWSGAFQMGLRHGLYCAGCCWLIMTVLFVAGLMNLAWIAGLTLIVLAEKVLPFGRWVSYSVGAAALLWAGWLLARS